MCEYCGCRQIPPLSELMDEHIALLDLGHELQQALGRGDLDTATALFDDFTAKLDLHSVREETGVFAALRSSGDFLDEIGTLEAEHRDFEQVLAAQDLTAPGALERIETIVADLADHVDKEDLGIFPVSVVTLGHSGWDIVAQAHAARPTFLSDR